MKVLIAIGALSFALASCGGGPCGLPANELRGSMGELYDIEVDKVRVRKVDEETVAVEYKHGNDIVAKVIADVRAFAKGVQIPLSGGDVRRITSPETSYPTDIERGDVTFESDLAPGSEVSGCFHALFNLPDGSQRTLEGGFHATLEDLP
jgi:hypothetical protein